VIGPTSLGLLLDAVGVSLLSYAVFSTTSKLRKAVEQSIARAELALGMSPSDAGFQHLSATPAPAPPDLQASLHDLRRERRDVQWHLWIIVAGAACVISGLTSQLSGTWPN
jgi:hypothetical protein